MVESLKIADRRIRDTVDEVNNKATKDRYCFLLLKRNNANTGAIQSNG
jgi:hypothetical protein